MYSSNQHTNSHIGGLDYILPPNPINFPSGQTSVTVIVTIISDPAFTLNKQFSMMLRSTGSGALSFRQDEVNVVIIDEQGIHTLYPVQAWNGSHN